MTSPHPPGGGLRPWASSDLGEPTRVARPFTATLGSCLTKRLTLREMAVRQALQACRERAGERHCHGPPYSFWVPLVATALVIASASEFTVACLFWPQESPAFSA